MAKVTFKLDPTPEGYVRVHVAGASNYIPDVVLLPGESHECTLDVTPIVGPLTQQEIIQKLVAVLERYPTDIYDLVGSELYHALEDNGYLF